MLNIELIKQVLLVSIASGCVTTLAVQKIKEKLATKKWIFYINAIISLVFGFLFAKSFSNLNWFYCIWTGFFTWIDADLLYKSLEDKILDSFSSLNKKREDEIIGEIKLND